MKGDPRLGRWLAPWLFTVSIGLATAHAGAAGPERQLVTLKVTVRKGDTLGAIAARNGVRLADLRRWNRGRIGPGDVIRRGATLVVKVSADKADPTLTGTAPDAKKHAATRATEPGTPPPGMWEDHLRVRRGDSLGRIAKRLVVALDDLMAWNRLTLKSKIKAGQRLVVYRPGPRPAPQSVGRPTAGSLAYGQHLGEGPGYRLRFPNNAYAVEGVLKTLRTCARRTKESFPGAHDLLIGDLSRAGGGHFAPHESHQSGRDADVGYYLRSNEPSATLHRVKPEDIDYAKTWALVRCHITTDVVTRVYMDRRIQVAMVAWLRQKRLVKEGQIQRLFAVEGGEEAVIQHAKEHDTHFHVRFACDVGQIECVEELDEEPFDL